MNVVGGNSRLNSEKFKSKQSLTDFMAFQTIPRFCGIPLQSSLSFVGDFRSGNHKLNVAMYDSKQIEPLEFHAPESRN
jgi:hypothetical protein